MAFDTKTPGVIVDIIYIYISYIYMFIFIYIYIYIRSCRMSTINCRPCFGLFGAPEIAPESRPRVDSLASEPALREASGTPRR